MGLINVIETNFTIFIGIVVTFLVMGTAGLYDKYQREGKISLTPGDPNTFSGLNQKLGNFVIDGLKSFSVYSNSLWSLIQKQRTPGKSSPEHAETKYLTKYLKLINGIQKCFGGLLAKLAKIRSFSFELAGKGGKNKDEKLASSSNIKMKPLNSGNDRVNSTDKVNSTNKVNSTDKVNSFDIDKLVESKKNELDFDDDLLSEMSTGGSLQGSSSAVTKVAVVNEPSDTVASLNTDFGLDDNEFDLGLGAMEEDAPKDDLLFSDVSKGIQLGDESDDSLLESLKKDIIIQKQEKIDFMADMRGENLNLELLKSDLEGVFRDLKKLTNYSK